MSRTGIPHRRKGHEQQRWPTAGSNPCSGLFRGWYGAEVASLSSMKIVLTNETEKFTLKRKLNVKLTLSTETIGDSLCLRIDQHSDVKCGIIGENTINISQNEKKNNTKRASKHFISFSFFKTKSHDN
jgi:hypothetical protein